MKCRRRRRRQSFQAPVSSPQTSRRSLLLLSVVRLARLASPRRPGLSLAFPALKPGELIKDPHFTLFESVGALEVSWPIGSDELCSP